MGSKYIDLSVKMWILRVQYICVIQNESMIMV